MLPPLSFLRFFKVTKAELSGAHYALFLPCVILDARCPTGLSHSEPVPVHGTRKGIRTARRPVVFPCPVLSDVSKNVPASPDVHLVELRSLAREPWSPRYALLFDAPTVGAMFPLSFGGAQLFGSS